MTTNTDYLSRSGAASLAFTINAYWHRRGYPQVKAERYEMPGHDDDWGVRSNLVAGLPPSTERKH